MLTAVDNLSFGISAGECFGLLGVNGAGKTTTFRMMTGDTPMSGGSITIDGFDVQKSMTDVRRRIGYCPQYNGLIDLMTGAEMIAFFARLRGVREEDIAALVPQLVKDFDLEMICNKPCGTYSGGNKRKLSTAIALVGNPPVVFLDEPTTVRELFVGFLFSRVFNLSYGEGDGPRVEACDLDRLGEGLATRTEHRIDIAQVCI
jgi:ATP-binding cassette subfamily A (ABC1) protein 3